VRKPDPYKVTVAVPMIGIFLGDEDEIITAGSWKTFWTDELPIDREAETVIVRSNDRDREVEPLANFTATHESLVHTLNSVEVRPTRMVAEEP
jgi:hypothetical protein